MAWLGGISHGTAYLLSSQRYYLTASGIGEAAQVLDFDTPSDFVRAYPVAREWLALLIRRMDAVATIYRLAASLSPGVDGLRSHAEFHRRGRFDATITLHAGRSFGVVRQGVKGGDKVYHRGVDGQRKCPAKWPAKMSLELLAMITDGSYPPRWRFMGGLTASMYFFAVSRWMASSRATLRIDRPLRFAFCTAFHLAV